MSPASRSATGYRVTLKTYRTGEVGTVVDAEGPQPQLPIGVEMVEWLPRLHVTRCWFAESELEPADA